MSTVVSELRGFFPGRPSWRARRALELMLETVLAGAALLGEMPFLDHLEELRRRLIKCLIALGVGSFVGFLYTAPIMTFLNAPAASSGIHLVAIDGFEVFSVYFKVAAATGICLAAPVLLWQIWRFVEPALYKHEKRYAAPFIISTTVCFVLGIVFGYTVVVPWLLNLEREMANAAGISITMSSESYLSTLTTTLISMGAIFEMPPIVFVLSRIGLINARFLIRSFRYAFLLFSVAAAVLTPSTTIPPMLFFMTVMTGIYMVSIVVAMIFGKTRKAE